MKNYRAYTGTGLITVCLLAITWLAVGCDESGTPPIDTDKHILLAPTEREQLVWALNTEVVVEPPFVEAVKVSPEALDPPSAFVPARTVVGNADFEEDVYATFGPGIGALEVFAALLGELQEFVTTELGIPPNTVDCEKSSGAKDIMENFNRSATLEVGGETVVKISAYFEDSQNRTIQRFKVTHRPHCLKGGWSRVITLELLKSGVFAIVGQRRSGI
jgi:hypothetical protein